MTGKCLLNNIKSYANLKYKQSGVYVLRENGVIRKVGSAKIGIIKGVESKQTISIPTKQILE